MTPTGPIQTRGVNCTWESITRYDDLIRAAADPVGWPITRIRGTIAIESAGNPAAVQRNPRNGDSFGLMQVVPYGTTWDGWHKLVKKQAGLPGNASKQKVINALHDPPVNIAVGVAILESYYQQHGTLDKANSAFFLGNPDWRGEDTVNGNSGTWYRKTLNALITEQDAFAPEGDVIDLLFGGNRYEISATYGQLVTWSCPGCYDYFSTYGLDTAHHWAYDVAAVAGDGAPLFAPFNGSVVCGGSDRGPGAWGTGCARFGRVANYAGAQPAGQGAGRLELLHEDGDRSLIIGHVLSSRVHPGDRVQAGDLIGQQGGMNGSHVHLEARYANGTRIGDPRALFRRGPLPVTFAERLPVPQPEDFEVSIEVTATQDGVPVLQRADLNAAHVREPLQKGETFEAVYQVVGNDRRIYWVTSLGSRIPMEGTSAPDWKGGPPGRTGVNPETVADLVEGVRSDIDTQLRSIIASLSTS